MVPISHNGFAQDPNLAGPQAPDKGCRVPLAPRCGQGDVMQVEVEVRCVVDITAAGPVVQASATR